MDLTRPKSLDIAKDAALKAGSLLSDQFWTGNQVGSLKADRTLVTEADEAADQLIREIILNAFPEDGILSEEASTTLPETEYVWIIDPLDGTVNFSRGLNYWGVSIARLKNGYPDTAAVFFPLTDELFTASLGEGASLNGKQLRVNPEYNPDLFPIFVHCSRMHETYQVDLPYKKRSLGAAAYHLCLIANNTAILGFESTVRIWDFAASWLIIQEAGGVVESFGDQQPFPAIPGKDYHKVPFPIAAAISENVLAEARKKVKSVKLMMEETKK
jgi:myo-inositol-1(or 4)-monophosphatase